LSEKEEVLDKEGEGRRNGKPGAFRSFCASLGSLRAKMEVQI